MQGSASTWGLRNGVLRVWDWLWFSRVSVFVRLRVGVWGSEAPRGRLSYVSINISIVTAIGNSVVTSIANSFVNPIVNEIVNSILIALALAWRAKLCAWDSAISTWFRLDSHRHPQSSLSAFRSYFVV